MHGSKRLKCILIMSVIYAMAFSNDIFYAEIYPENSPDSLAYTHTNKIWDRGDSTVIEHYYFTPEGELYVLDKVILINDEPVYNSLEFYEIGEYSSFTRIGDNAELIFESEEKFRRNTRKLQKPLVFAPTQQQAIKENLPLLSKGEIITFYIFASQALRLVEMKVQQIEGSEYEREGCMVLIMRPKNIFIDWFVDEVYYVVEISTGRIMEMHGFSTLRQKVDDVWEFRDMDFYFSYE